MTTAFDPQEFLSGLEQMYDYWCSAEIEVRMGLSLAEGRATPLPLTIKRRTAIVISRNLARAADRQGELRRWLDAGTPHADLIHTILKRINATAACWTKLLAVMRAKAVMLDPPDPRAITSARDLPGWLLELQAWASPEHEIIADLTRAIAAKDSRSDEALDHVQWSAEDDIAAVDQVLARSMAWPLDADTRRHLETASEQAKVTLGKLLALVDKARPYTIMMKTAEALAEMAHSQGDAIH